MSEPLMADADPLGREQYREEDIHSLSRLDNMVIHIPVGLKVEHRKNCLKYYKKLMINMEKACMIHCFHYQYL
jgi:hypothetical protein